MSKQAIKHLKTDSTMAKLIERVGPLPLRPRRLPPFQSLLQAIVYQQLSGAAAATIFGRFLDLFPGEEFPTPRRVLKMPQAKLRSAGLSNAKTNYILDLALKAKQGLVPSLEECAAMSDDALIEGLTQIKGVGRWTVEMLLIFNLGRPDLLPVDDLGVRRGYQVAYRKRELPKPARLQKLGEAWAPHRTAAALYLWKAADMLKEGAW